jgi:hypothetical protein
MTEKRCLCSLPNSVSRVPASKVKKAFGAIFNAGVGFSLQPSLIKLGETRDLTSWESQAQMPHVTRKHFSMINFYI